MTKQSPSILVLDIETAPIEAYVWDLWEQNVSLEQIKTDWSILAYCAKWVGSRELIYQDTGGRGVSKVRDDSRLLTGLHALLDEADIVVAQNGKKFDIKKINARLIEAGYKPYSPIRVVDTLEAAKKHFGFTSNKLAWLTKKLTKTKKSDHKKFPGFELWIECLLDNPRAWAEMKKYNQVDVIGCAEVYEKLLPWIGQHPNVRTYDPGADAGCPKCGSAKLQRRGTTTTQHGQYARYQCTSCGGWSRGKTNLLDKDKRKALQVQ